MKKSWFLLGTLTFIVNTAFATAYLDPNSGSLLLQILVGIVTTIVLFAKGLRYRIKTFFQKVFKK